MNGNSPAQLDRQQHHDEYRASIESPDLRADLLSRAGQRAALRLATALGQCRIVGSSEPELAHALTPPIALAAARLLAQWAEADRKGLLATADEADDEDLIVVELECLDVIHGRHLFWAAVIGLEESLVNAGEAECHDLSEAIETARLRLAEFDETMREHLSLLCVVAENPSLNRMREELAEPYRSAPPWWLDGTLDLAAAEMVEKAVKVVGEVGERINGLVQQTVVLAPEPQARQLLRLPERSKTFAAADVSTKKSRRLKFLWASPDGRYVAELLLPATPTAADESKEHPLNITLRVDTTDAVLLKGQSLSLAGVNRTLDEMGRCTIPLPPLRTAENLALLINNELWNRMA